MEIAYGIIFYLIAALTIYYQISLFITQFYNAKRMLILEKQKLRGFQYNLFFLCSLFLIFLSVGLAFEHIIYSDAIILIAFFISFLSYSKISFRFTRRSIILLVVSLLIIGAIICFKTLYVIYFLSILFILFPAFFVIVFNYLVYPIEYFVRQYYIKKAQKKLKMNKNLKIIAITGSYGKTSFKNYLYTILNGKLNVLKTPGSVNTPMGICKFINSELTPYDDYLILELGVDAPKSMKKFFKIFTPDLGIITSIGPMHIATFKNIENIRKEKLTLFDYVKDENGMFYNSDSKEIILNGRSKKSATGYSFKEIEILSQDYTGTTFKFQNHTCQVRLLGKYQLTNLIGAIKVAKYLSVNDEIIYQRLGSILPENHRMSIEVINNTKFIDDSYNNNFLELSSSIEILNNFVGTKGIILTGLIETGDKSDSINYQLGQLLINFQEIVVLSNSNKGLVDGLKSINKQYKTFDKYLDGLSYLKKKNLDYVLLCSNAHEEYIK